MINKLTPEIIALLGTMPDSDVAKQFNLSRSTITGYRKKLGISAYVKPATPLECPKCHHIGATHSTANWYRCLACKHQFSIADNPKGRPMIGDRPLTPYEKVKRSLEKKKKNFSQDT